MAMHVISPVDFGQWNMEHLTIAIAKHSSSTMVLPTHTCALYGLNTLIDYYTRDGSTGFACL